MARAQSHWDAEGKKKYPLFTSDQTLGKHIGIGNGVAISNKCPSLPDGDYDRCGGNAHRTIEMQRRRCLQRRHDAELITRFAVNDLGHCIIMAPYNGPPGHKFLCTVASTTPEVDGALRAVFHPDRACTRLSQHIVRGHRQAQSDANQMRRHPRLGRAHVGRHRSKDSRRQKVWAPRKSDRTIAPEAESRHTTSPRPSRIDSQ